MAADIEIQAGVGKFFAYKFRSGVSWSLYQSTGDKAALTEAVKAYRTARRSTTVDPTAVRKMIGAVLARPKRLSVTAHQTPAAHFNPGKPLEVSVAFNPNGNHRKVDLFYRQADQSQRWHSAEMQMHDNEFRATIPADYTQSPYPLEYYFEVHESGESTILPGFSPDLSNQPYILVRRNPGKV
jgi:hypothetical protein